MIGISMEYSITDLKWRPIAVIIISTLLLVADRYHNLFSNKVYDRTFFYLVIPLLVILIIFGEKPSKYGFQFGLWRRGLVYVVVFGIGALGLMYALSLIPEFRSYYNPLILSNPLPLPLMTFLDLFGWEFLFRGFLLFSLYEICGPYAILIQAVPFTIAHIGKPALETYSCILGGTFFGWLAWRTRSFLYPFFLHWIIATSLIYFSNLP